jgi:hypothetical protein
MNQYKMIRTLVSKSSFKEADGHVTYYVEKSPLERLNAACFIIYSIFNTTERTKVDRLKTSSRKNAKLI